MPAKAGDFPWKKSYSKDNLSFDYLSGWHTKRSPGWQQRSKDKGHSFTRVMYSPDGTKHRVRVYGKRDKDSGAMRPSYRDYIGYSAGNSSNEDEMLAAAEFAFNGEHKDAVECPDTGHITKLEYAIENDNTGLGIMRVTFLNGDICLFFNVPPAVYGTLKHHAIHKTTAGMYRAGGEYRKRHLLGVEFWNLVRIRGHQHNAKYPFSYERKAEGKIVRHSKRRIVSLTPDIAEAILQGDKHSDFHIRMLRNLKPDTKVSVVLSDEEFAAYADELRKQGKEVDAQRGGYYTLDAANSYDAEGNFTGDASTISGGGEYAGSYVKPGSISPEEQSIRTRLGKYLHDTLKSKVTDLMNEDITKAAILAYEADGMSETQARKAFLQDWYQNTSLPWAKGVNQRTGATKSSLSEDATEALGRVVLGNGGLRTWYQKNLPAKEGAHYTRVVWTPQMLKDFANPKVPGNISEADAPKYKAYIKAKDWEGALRFLKSHTFRYDYVKTKGHGKTAKQVKVHRNIAYAADDDVLGYE